MGNRICLAITLCVLISLTGCGNVQEQLATVMSEVKEEQEESNTEIETTMHNQMQNDIEQMEILMKDAQVVYKENLNTEDYKWNQSVYNLGFYAPTDYSIITNVLVSLSDEIDCDTTDFIVSDYDDTLLPGYVEVFAPVRGKIYSYSTGDEDYGCYIGKWEYNMRNYSSDDHFQDLTQEEKRLVENVADLFNSDKSLRLHCYVDIADMGDASIRSVEIDDWRKVYAWNVNNEFCVFTFDTDDGTEPMILVYADGDYGFCVTIKDTRIDVDKMFIKGINAFQNARDDFEKIHNTRRKNGLESYSGVIFQTEFEKHFYEFWEDNNIDIIMHN